MEGFPVEYGLREIQPGAENAEGSDQGREALQASESESGQIERLAGFGELGREIRKQVRERLEASPARRPRVLLREHQRQVVLQSAVNRPGKGQRNFSRMARAARNAAEIGALGLRTARRRHPGGRRRRTGGLAGGLARRLGRDFGGAESNDQNQDAQLRLHRFDSPFQIKSNTNWMSSSTEAFDHPTMR